MDEIVRVFNWIIDQGYAFYWGTSEWSSEEIRQAWEIAEKLNLIGPCAEQAQCKLIFKILIKEIFFSFRQYVTSYSS
jgi:aryl-alcohol dehydrogenase-like predicted oxidoreductase